MILSKEEKFFHNIIKEEWFSHCKENKLYGAKGCPTKMPVFFLNKIAKSVFKNQLSKIQEEIVNHLLQHPVTKKDDEGEDEENADLTAACWQIFTEAGFISFTMVAGLGPSEGGNILVYVVSKGTMAEGSPSEQVKHSLPGMESLRNYTVPAGKPLPLKPIASTSKALMSSVTSQDELGRNTLQAMGCVVEDDTEDNTNMEIENITPVLLVSLELNKLVHMNPKEKKQRAPCTKRMKGMAAVRKSARFVASPSEEPELVETSMPPTPTSLATMSAPHPHQPDGISKTPAMSSAPIKAPAMADASSQEGWALSAPLDTLVMPRSAGQAPATSPTDAPVMPSSSTLTTPALIKEEHSSGGIVPLAMSMIHSADDMDVDATHLLAPVEASQWLKDAAEAL
ncbi:hypothetical protein BDN71DRAFT_1433920 [Pleurotus eryngii]|uniref:Uncharacterized protein n=1 Tax=Pleurotus eryngii TaxID=5323 RepID=A0A9P6D546_PLEER|nr:hypothetical protein BDN71DRAFT_1433920 [Pleurotus eryngii]